MLRAAETARSLLEPTTKLSRVYFEFKPDSLEVVCLRPEEYFLIRFLIGLLTSSRETSRERVRGREEDWTSKVICSTITLLFSRAVRIIS